MQLLIFAGGLLALIAGANLLVRGASKLALSFGISPLVVGLTVVAFGTQRARDGGLGRRGAGRARRHRDRQCGRGSNIFNVLLILGASALIAPLVVNIQLIRQEVPIMIGASLLLLGLDGRISWFDGAVLFGLLLLYTAFLVVQSRRETQAAKDEYTEALTPAAAAT